MLILGVQRLTGSQNQPDLHSCIDNKIKEQLINNEPEIVDLCIKSHRIMEEEILEDFHKAINIENESDKTKHYDDSDDYINYLVEKERAAKAFQEREETEYYSDSITEDPDLTQAAPLDFGSTQLEPDMSSEGSEAEQLSGIIFCPLTSEEDEQNHYRYYFEDGSHVDLPVAESCRAELFCASCTQLCNSPQSVCHTHIVCQKCVNNLKRSPIDSRYTYCPDCQSSRIIPSEDSAKRKEIDKILVRCPAELKGKVCNRTFETVNIGRHFMEECTCIVLDCVHRDKGCTFRGGGGDDLEKHQKECVFFIPAHNCHRSGYRLMVRQMADLNRVTICEAPLVTCPDCQNKYMKKELDQHRRKSCLLSQLTCLSGDCSTTFPRLEQNSHDLYHCSEATVHCSFCSLFVLKGELKKHQISLPLTGEQKSASALQDKTTLCLDHMDMAFYWLRSRSIYGNTESKKTFKVKNFDVASKVICLIEEFILRENNLFIDEVDLFHSTRHVAHGVKFLQSELSHIEYAPETVSSSKTCRPDLDHHLEVKFIHHQGCISLRINLIGQIENISTVDKKLRFIIITPRTYDRADDFQLEYLGYFYEQPEKSNIQLEVCSFGNLDTISFRRAIYILFFISELDADWFEQFDYHQPAVDYISSDSSDSDNDYTTCDEDDETEPLL